jgi:hypothetical protein
MKNKTIKDMRGEQFAANRIDIIDNIPYAWGAFLIKNIVQTELHRSKHFYNIIGTEDVILGMIALTEGDYNYLSSLLNLPKVSTQQLPYNICKGEWILIIEKIIESYENSKKGEYLTYNDYINSIIEIKTQLNNVRTLNTLSTELKELI